MNTDFDVVICGSGAGGLLAAVRLHDLGLRPIVIEKAHRYGGTSATSGGGIWIPDHGIGGGNDSREQALTYLHAVSGNGFRADKLAAYVDRGREMIGYLARIGVPMMPVPGFPDYIAGAPGASTGRSLFPTEMDGADLGEAFFNLRESPLGYRLFGRYALNLQQSFALSARRTGWQWVAARLILKYWLDLSWRRRTHHDRRLTMGRALIGGLRKAMLDRDIPLLLDCGATGLSVDQGRVTGVEAILKGNAVRFDARAGVILAAGGFEQNQALRDELLPVTTDARWSLTPKGMNVGDALLMGSRIGADTECLDANWWAPSMQLPSRAVPNLDVAQPMFFDHRHPFSLCVNRLGRRFVNESCSYDEFGQAMIADQQRTGANIPCWMVFDAKFRARYPCGAILPSFVMPDRSLPVEWWDSYIFKADSIEALAVKMGVDAVTLADTVGTMNLYARNGKDEAFGRGENGFDRYFGKGDVGPNPCMGPVDTPPYYAVRIDLGDLGSKGGLKTDADGRVMPREGKALSNLYAIGNSAGSPFGDCYPGGGGTLGPATVFAYIAADHIAGSIR